VDVAVGFRADRRLLGDWSGGNAGARYPARARGTGVLLTFNLRLPKAHPTDVPNAIFGFQERECESSLRRADTDSNPK